jgi:ATP-dependent DNA helicase RecG
MGTFMREISLETPFYDVLGARTPFLKRFEKIGIKNVRDLLLYFPSRYEDFSKVSLIDTLESGELATIRATVQDIKFRRTRRGLGITEATLADESGTIRATWFNQSYLAQTLYPGRAANFSGKVSLSEGHEIYLNNPAYEIVKPNTETIHTSRLIPIYPETKGLTSRGIRFAVRAVLNLKPKITEWIPEEILASYHLPDLSDAIREVHFPDSIEDAITAQQRFRFESLFLIQLFNLRQKLNLDATPATAIPVNIERIKDILAALPFQLTQSQKRSLWEIVQDLAKPRPMNRLLQGDVGSGKTIVAAIAAMMAAEHGSQTVFMAPTEILARQHFETFQKFLRQVAPENQPVIGLVTGSGTIILSGNDLVAKTPKSEFWKKSASGEIAVIFGTHALIERSARFKNLGLVVIDEQHRFGVHQRQALIRGQTQTKTRTNADEKDEKSANLLYENLTYNIRGCALTLKKNLGLGRKELIYQKALATEFKDAGLTFEREKKIPVIYKGEKMGTYQPDFLIDDKIIVELKALPFIGKNELKQVWTYLKGSPYKLALLINFSPTGVDFTRIVNDAAQESQRLSAPSPRESASMPHFLSMSATPIPRTIMQTIFGNLDLSLITELPAGRKPIITKIVTPAERPTTYDFIRAEIKKGRQAFVICPLIEPDSDTTASGHPVASSRSLTSNHAAIPANVGIRENKNNQNLVLQWGDKKKIPESMLELKSVKVEYEKLSKKIFPDLRIAILHGKMKPKEKETVMRDFKDKKYDILVATSIIEVGVDVPNAAIMIIEGADRFGLAQLYQFRGRIGRGDHQSYCFLMTDVRGEKATARLRAILKAKNGFELAEEDLKLRGPGEFIGVAQSGFSDATLEALRDPELVKIGREAASRVIAADPTLAHHPPLKSQLASFTKNLHRE